MTIDNTSLFYILDKIQKDVDMIDHKQDEYLVISTKLVSQLDTVSTKVSELNKLMLLDNGKPSVVSQLNHLSGQLKTTACAITETKELVSKLHTDLVEVQKHIGMKTPKEVTIERWKTVGRIGGGILAVIPGILAFVHNFL